jgi:hypothetical protein
MTLAGQPAWHRRHCAILVGHPEEHAACTATTQRPLIERMGQKLRVATYYKHRLPSYDVFDEKVLFRLR